MNATFDPTQPLAAAPEPWDSTAQPSPRDGPPYHLTEMIAAEPDLAVRILERLADPQGPAEARGGRNEAAEDVGVPEITPVLDRLRPAGRLPDASEKTYGVNPPLAVSVWL